LGQAMALENAYIGEFGDLESAKIAAYVRQWEE
jgi:hypothetical protein